MAKKTGELFFFEAIVVRKFQRWEQAQRTYNRSGWLFIIEVKVQLSITC
jgi:hypothetical protein